MRKRGTPHFQRGLCQSRDLDARGNLYVIIFESLYKGILVLCTPRSVFLHTLLPTRTVQHLLLREAIESQPRLATIIRLDLVRNPSQQWSTHQSDVKLRISALPAPHGTDANPGKCGVHWIDGQPVTPYVLKSTPDTPACTWKDSNILTMTGLIPYTKSHDIHSPIYLIFLSSIS